MAEDYTDWPQASDVQAIFTNTGITLPAGLDYEGAILGAIADFEDQTGWRPFLAKPENTVRLFDPPRSGPTWGRSPSNGGGHTLELNAGILDLPFDGVSIGYINPISNPAIASPAANVGTVLTGNYQYYLLPENCFERHLPCTAILFESPVFGVPRSIRINATWGRVKTLRGDVWTAVARKAAAALAPEIALSISQGLAQWSRNDTDVKFSQGRGDTGPLAQQVVLWDSQFNQLVTRYQRVTM